MLICTVCGAVGNTVDTLMYGWLANPVDIDESLQVSQFTLVDYVQSDCAQNYTAGAATVSSIYSHAWASAHRGKWGQLTPPWKKR